jgi:hypothetical protein
VVLRQGGSRTARFRDQAATFRAFIDSLLWSGPTGNYFVMEIDDLGYRITPAHPHPGATASGAIDEVARRMK